MRGKIRGGFTLAKEGLKELIAHLKKREVKRIIASSATLSRINYMCEAAGVSGDFDEIVCGQDVEKGKPAPDIFNLAVKKSGFTKEECIVLEDSINGVKAGLAAGIKTVHIPDKSCLGLWSDELPETPKGAVRADSLLDLCTAPPARTVATPA
jgi:beta-phosphoglucomutase-like phosphatase (HAD superfamily)